MKIILPFLLLTLIACSKAPKEQGQTTAKPTMNPEQVASDSVSAYLKRTLDNPAAYQSNTFRNFKTLSGRDSVRWLIGSMEYEIKSDPTILHNIDYAKSTVAFAKSQGDKSSIKEAEIKLKSVSDSLKAHKNRIEIYKTQIVQLQKELQDSSKYNYLKGYQVDHTFRATNRLGGTILTAHRFRLDKNLRVIDSWEIK